MSKSNQTFRGKLSGVTAGDPLFFDAQSTTTPGSTTTLITHTVASGKVLYLLSADITCRQQGVFIIKIDSDIIASGRTGAGNMNPYFVWVPYREASTGEIVKIEFSAMSGRPSTDIEAYLQTRNVSV
jgi:hypothetical protein